MRTFTKFAVAAAIVAGMTGTASAQTSSGGFFRAPVLLAQPGVVTAGAVSCDDCESVSGFNARFTVVVPTASPWFNLVMGTQFQPNGLGGSKDNRPGFYYGAIIPVALLGTATQGWLSLSIDPLGVYGPSGADASSRPYAHEFFLEAAFVLNIGSKMMQNMGPWSGLGVYFLVDQQITHLPEDAEGDTDRFNPVLLYGLSLPIAPWGR